MTEPSPDGPAPARPGKVVWAVILVLVAVLAALLVVYLRDDTPTPAATPTPGTAEPTTSGTTAAPTTEPTATATPAPTAPSEPATSEPATTDPGEVRLSQSCENPLGFTISYPQGWDVNDEPLPEPCVWFSPDQIQAPPAASDAVVGPIVVRVQEGVDLERAADPDPASETVTDRRESTVDQRRAVRIEASFVGGGAFADDPRTVYWVVDVPPGPDGTPRALLAQAFPWDDELPIEEGASVLDDMMATLRFTG
ncbi:hypothetical protein [Georgenia subflava]|uniref:Uncharacterized protein n=1 Tax=Georgenia subflava TaxID=1622177 RepID=A0A6N7EFP7_9MICO|nr:hypothetical protein [Georgenia subflava]MPV36860.1 hypothetical protein [Georgenia subflava]